MVKRSGLVLGCKIGGGSCKHNAMSDHMVQELFPLLAEPPAKGHCVAACRAFRAGVVFLCHSIRLLTAVQDSTSSLAQPALEGC